MLAGPSSHPFRCKGSWSPPCGREPVFDTFITAVQQDLMSSQSAVIRDNLSKQERVANKKLQKRVDIVIKPADNGSGTVIMGYNWYVDECLRQLNDNRYYQKQTKDLTRYNEELKNIPSHVQR